ncbi:hypothetical protein [Deminuibacter soli]|nr:hypothetical protein [Deminuibacter soli]
MYFLENGGKFRIWSSAGLIAYANVLQGDAVCKVIYHPAAVIYHSNGFNG